MPPIRDSRVVPQRADQQVDEESMLLLAEVAATTSPGDRQRYHRYASFDQCCTGNKDDDATTVMTPSSSVATWDEEVLSESDEATLQKRDSLWSSCCMSAWNVYYGWLERNPLLIKSLTAFVLMGLADALAQGVEVLRGLPDPETSDATTPSVDGSDPGFDWLRMLRFAIFGLVGAPWTHYYYAWLDRALPPTRDPWTWTTFVKVVIDQFLQAPALLALIIMGLAFMEGRGIDGMRTDMESQYKYSLIQNWKLWIPATVVNIAFVKPTLRVLFDNVIFLGWTIYLSMILNGDHANNE